MTSLSYNPEGEDSDVENYSFDQQLSEVGFGEGLSLAGVCDVTIGDDEKQITSSDSFLVDRYVSYQILTTIKMEGRRSDRGATYEVYRRYREFEILRNHLVATYPAVIVPPLPEKVVSVTWKNGTPELDKFNEKLIEERKAAFEVFLKKICSHPTLSAHPAFHDFLSKNTEFKEIMAGSDVKSESFFKQLGAQVGLKKPDKRFSDLKQYADTLENSVKAVLTAIRQLAIKRAAYYKLYGHLGKVFSEWSAFEPEMGDSLQKAGHYFDSLGDLIDNPAAEEEKQVTLPLKEYQLYPQALRSVAKKGELLQYQCEQAEENLAAKAKLRDDFARNPGGWSWASLSARLFRSGQSTEERLKAYESDVEQADQNMQQSQEKLG
jgi:sorting nexin-4